MCYTKIMKNYDFTSNNYCVISSDLAISNLTISDSELLLINHEIASIDQEVHITLHSQSSCTIELFDASHSIIQTSRTLKYHITLNSGARVKLLFGLLETSLLTIQLYLHLQGSNSQASVFGVYALDGEQELKIQTYQMHKALSSVSNVNVRGILKGNAKAHIEGLIRIDENGSKSDASLENKNIVWSGQARVVSIPSIEVLQHEVQCCHGSAVGTFDEKQSWYLQSRGLDVGQARKLLIVSFFGVVVSEFKNSEAFMEMVCKKMI